jgi:SAM-dependent methyltransferase
MKALFARMPALRSLLLDAIDAAARLLLVPFRTRRPQADPAAAAALLANVDRLNASAETYFASVTDVAHALGKPYSEPEALSRRLIDVGILLDGLRLQPGHIVLDLGGGTGWLSHMLNRFGCPTITMDVSPTAVALSRRLFDDDPQTNHALNPQFLAYDGHRLPLAPASVDRAILYDAFHHIPNQQEILAELRRVLRPDGIVAMSEPGRGHARSASSMAEAATGVLENELVLEDIADLALQAGFAAARVIVDTNRPPLEIDAGDLRSFMGGRGFARYWRNLCAGLDGHHYLLLFAGSAEPTTRQPRRLSAVIRRIGAGRGRLRLEFYNAGDTVWLCGENAPGWTRAGIHLYRDDRERTLVDYDWVRAALPHDVAPEHRVTIDMALPPFDRAGDYFLVIDLVIEGVAWFADRGSVPLSLAWRVEL